MQEIERKWIISINDLTSIAKNYKCKSKSKIEQIYLDKDTRIRERDYGEKVEYTKTTKNGTGMIRDEKTEVLTSFQYADMRFHGIRRLSKRRIVFDLENELEMEVDIYPNQDFILLEIEFDSQIKAESFVEPFTFQKEVTGDKNFNNFNIAKEC